jgi:GMP reductase
MIIHNDVKLDFNDVLLQPRPTVVTSRQEVDLSVEYTTKHSGVSIKGIPIISANMSSVSTFSMAKALASQNMFCALHKHYIVTELVDFFNNATPNQLDHTFYTLGMHDLKKFSIFLKNTRHGPPKLICIDAANGYMTKFNSFVKSIRKMCPKSVIMAGNVVTPEGVELLVNSGADIVKIGIGSSAACRTRKVAGTGVPQFSAIIECYQTVKDMKALYCSDGGANNPGDFGKAFAGGADFVMSGTMFAGHDECEGSIINGNKMEFYGMSSEVAMNKHSGGMASYRASEGIHTLVDYKGPVSNTVNTILGGLRSTGSYINARKLEDFCGQAQFVRVNRTYNNLFGE